MKKNQFTIVFFVVVLSIFLQQCLALCETLTISGTGDSQVLLRALAEKFEEKHPQVDVMVPDSVGSGGGIKALIQGKSNLARVARPLTEEELSHDLQYTLFAHSPVVFVVHPSVTGVNNLSYAQIVSIYSGQINNWKQLGGQDKKIYVVNREPGDSSRTILDHGVPGLKSIDPFAGKVFYTTPEAKEALIKYPDTIGYLPMAMVKGTKLHVLHIENVEPTAHSVTTGTYALSVPLALVSKKVRTDTEQEFLNFLSEAASQEIITEYTVGVP